MKTPGSNKLVKGISLVSRFESFSHGRIAYFLYCTIWKIAQTNFSFLLKILPKFKSAEFRERKYYSLGYKVNFLTGNYRKAYSLRLTYAVSLEKDLRLDNNSVGVYLDTIWTPELVKILSFEDDIKDYLENRKSENIFDQFLENKNKIKVNKILFAGPSSNLSEALDREYDKICLTKPIDLDEYNIDPSSVVLVLNNAWSIYKRDFVEKWLEKYPGILLYTPNMIGDSFPRSEIFSTIPSYPFESGIMGLQRAMTIIIQNFDFESIEIVGFDLMLSKQPYNDWYPNLHTETGFNYIDQAILYSNMQHDFLLNLMYTRKLYELLHGKIYGSLDEIFSMSNKDILDIFFSRNILSKI